MENSLNTLNVIKHYIVYRTENVLTKEFYIGVHSQIENDSYLGSGLRIVRQISKYGKENFLRKTLFVFKTEIEAFNKEKELLTEFLKTNYVLTFLQAETAAHSF